MLNIENKWALVTGSSRGVGELVARFLAARGCNLVLHARSLSHIELLGNSLREQGIRVHLVEAELSNLDEVAAMLDNIEAAGIEIDLLFNNAGIQLPYRENFWETPANDFELSSIVNTVAPALICYRLIPGMIARGFGRVVNTTSGIDKDPHQAGYSASKAALDKFTNDLATAVNGTDVIVSLTDPGWLRTDLGGPNAPNAPETALPGVIVGAFVNDGVSGRYFSAQNFAGLSLEEAVGAAERSLAEQR